MYLGPLPLVRRSVHDHSKDVVFAETQESKKSTDSKDYHVQLITLISLLATVLLVMVLALIVPPGSQLIIFICQKLRGKICLPATHNNEESECEMATSGGYHKTGHSNGDAEEL